eukprot:GHVQ01006088.1.p1 GENE.GHVQ01006088.1~~GHVQ01006088.1.p1  ORF type:complete len:508 (+),score=100.85 GHVQ01006088.1:595-2118(+)
MSPPPPPPPSSSPEYSPPNHPARKSFSASVRPLDAPEGGGVCCSPCCNVVDEAEEVIWARRRREEMRENIRKVKGVSVDSECTYRRDIEAVVDEMQQSSIAIIPGGMCSCGLRPGAFSTCSCLLLWVVIYAVVMVALQLQLYKLVRNTELESMANQYIDANQMQYYMQSFHWFFSMCTIVTAIVITGTFCIARLLLGLQIYSLSSHVVEGVHDEYRTELKENLNGDFYDYVKRLNRYVVVSEDFTKSEMKKLHRQLNVALTDAGELLNFEDRSGRGVRAAVDAKIAGRRTCITFSFFILPSVLNILCNCILVYYVFDLRYRQHHSVDTDEFDLIEQEPLRAIQSEGFRLIGAALAVNVISWMYLVALMAGNTVYCMLKCLYPRIRLGSLNFTNRMVHRIWDEIVVEGLTPYIDEARPSILFIDPADYSPSAKTPLHQHNNHQEHLASFPNHQQPPPPPSYQQQQMQPLLLSSQPPTPHLLQQQQHVPPPQYAATLPYYTPTAMMYPM